MQGGMSLVLNCCSSSTSSSQSQLNLYAKLPLSSSPTPIFKSFSCRTSWNPNPNLNLNPKHQKGSLNIQNKGRLSQGLAAALIENETTRAFTTTREDEDDAHAQAHAHTMPKIDRCGRFCSPRAARELALLITYASCLQGSDPLRLFDNRLNVPRDVVDAFDRSTLLEYDHTNYAGPCVSVATSEEEEQLLAQFEKESAIEEAVLSAPPKLVYSKLLLRFTRKLLCAVVDRWDSHVLVIDKVAPQNWKIEPSGRILEFSILHLAMSEISVIGTNKKIVINEAVDLAKRFCDGTAPRIINGCLRTFVQDLP